MSKSKPKNRQKKSTESKGRPSPSNKSPNAKRTDSSSLSRTSPTIFGIPRSRLPHLGIFIIVAIGGSYAWVILTNGQGIKRFTYEILAEYPHDTKAYSQGLIYHNGNIIESTGHYGQSDIRQYDLESGKILKQKKLPDKYFGEGLTMLKGKFYQLTWKAGKGFVYDSNFKKIDEFEYKGDGWGLTNDGKHLIISNGSSTLKFIDPDTFEEVRRLSVRFGRNLRHGLNELEYFREKIYANDLNRSLIYQIDPVSGKITAEIDLRELVPTDGSVNIAEGEVLNGIAFREDTGGILVTGKNWPTIYEIKMVEKPSR